VTWVSLVTELVVIWNVAEVCPAPTVTVAGTWAAGLELESATTAPPTGAGRSSVTVPVEELPPRTAAGLTLTPVSTAGGAVNVRVVVWVTEL
jgi:hypothetical protein